MRHFSVLSSSNTERCSVCYLCSNRYTALQDCSGIRIGRHLRVNLLEAGSYGVLHHESGIPVRQPVHEHGDVCLHPSSADVGHRATGRGTREDGPGKRFACFGCSLAFRIGQIICSSPFVVSCRVASFVCIEHLSNMFRPWRIYDTLMQKLTAFNVYAKTLSIVTPKGRKNCFQVFTPLV